MGRIALILSSGRTGTKFLAHYFDTQFERVVGRHEPFPARWLRMASHAHLVGALSKARLARLLAYKRRRFPEPVGADLYVESNPFLVGFTEVLGEVWDEPTILHVVRDPRDHARSSLNHGTSSGVKGLANRFVPFWYPDVRRILALDHRPSWLERAAGVWQIGNSRLRDAALRFANYHLFHFEELFDETQSGLREMCRVLGLEFREVDAAAAPADRINAGHLNVLPHWREWDADRCVEIQRICSPLMQEYGYGSEPEWLARVSSHG